MSPLGRWLALRRLRDRRWTRLLDDDDSGEVVTLDCETTGLDTRRDEVLTIAAIKLRGRRILCGERLNLVIRPERAMPTDTVRVHWLRPVDVAAGLPMAEALPQLLDFIGSRPLLGYFIEFDVKILSRYTRELIGIPLPNEMIEVSSLYYKYRYTGRQWTGKAIDLKFDTIRRELGLPLLPQHDAYNDALSAAMIYLSLQDKLERGLTSTGAPAADAEEADAAAAGPEAEAAA
jgi:DNA polymerase-3 subunit epsilon